MLASLGLAGRYDACRNMRETHCRLHLVDILPTFAAASIRVHAHFTWVNLNIAFILQFSHHIDTGKTRVPTFIGIERRNTHQPVHSTLGLTKPKGILALNSKCGALDAGYFPGRQVLHRHRPTAAFAPALVHAQEHIRPITAFRATSSCVDGEDAVALVLRLLEHGL